MLLNLFANVGAKAFAYASPTSHDEYGNSPIFAHADAGSSTGVTIAHASSDT
jgi:hypothetical protein